MMNILIAVAVALTIGFGGGWQVSAWKQSADRLAEYVEIDRKQEAARRKMDALQYEIEKEQELRRVRDVEHRAKVAEIIAGLPNLRGCLGSAELRDRLNEALAGNRIQPAGELPQKSITANSVGKFSR